MLGAALGVVLAGVLLAKVLRAAAYRARDAAVSQLSKALGREVSAGEPELALFPPELRVRDVRISGDEGEPLLASAREVFVRPSLGTLVRGGHALRLARIELRGLELNLVRRRDGTWNVLQPGPREDCGDAPAQAGRPAEPPRIDLARISQATVRLVDAASGDEGVLLTEIDASASEIGPGLPLDLRLRGAQEDGEGTFEARLSLDRLPQHGLGSSGWPVLQGHVELRRIQTQPFARVLPGALSRIARHGEVSLNLAIRSRAGEPWSVDGDVQARRLELKGVDSGTRFAVRGTVEPARPEASVLELTELRLYGPGFDAQGRMTLTGFTHGRFALAGKRLDLGVLLAHAPNGRGAGQRSGEASSSTNEPTEHPWAPAGTRRVLEKLELEGTLALDELRVKALDFTKVRADAALEHGVLRLRSGTGSLFSGSVDAAGSWMDLRAALPPWRVTARLEQVHFGDALKKLAGAEPIRGDLNAQLDVAGTGTSWPALRPRLHGHGRISMPHGALGSIHLQRRLTPILRGPMEPATRILEQGTPFTDASAQFEVRDGGLVVEKPLRFESPFGPFSATGRLGLDGQLDMDGTVRVTPGFAGRIVGPLLRPGGSVEVPLSIHGRLKKPAVKTRPLAIARELLDGGQPPDGAPAQARGRSAPPANR